MNLSLDLDETTVIFGSNNTGKSTILNAIHAVLSHAMGRRSGVFTEYDYHLKAGKQPTEADPIEITLISSESTVDEWPESNIQQLGPVIGIRADGLQTITIRLTGKYDDALDSFTSNFDFLDPAGSSYPSNSNAVRRLQQIIPALGSKDQRYGKPM